MGKRLKLVLAVLFFVNIASAREIGFVGEGYNPEPNEEVTIQVQTDIPLLYMAAAIYIVGDVNITGAMCEADCNQYGWDNGWYSNPDIDPSGWVYIHGISWASDANGVVGYVKFHYNSGQVGVCMDQENSSAAGFDGNSCSDVPFTTNVLFFGEPDPNDPNFINPNDPNDPNIPNDPNDPNGEEFMASPIYFPNLAGDANIINFEDFAVFANNWQQCDTGLESDFDESGCVDFNDLNNFCYHWLLEIEPPEEVFGSFKTALAARDIDEAVNYISEISRDKYYDIFEAIEPNLPDFAAGMGAMTLVSEDAGQKKYEMLHQSGGETYIFQVVFIRDDDGEWRIFNF